MFKSRALTAVSTALALLISSFVSLPAQAVASIPAPTSVDIISHSDSIDVSFAELSQETIDTAGILTYQYSLDGGTTWCDRDDTETETTSSPITISAASDNANCVDSNGDSTADLAMVSGATYQVQIRAATAADEGDSNTAEVGFLGYQVAFKSNTDADLTENINFPVGTSKAMPAANLFTKAGYELTGWSSTAQGASQYAPGDAFTATQEGSQFFAVWELVTFDVTLEPGEGTLETSSFTFSPGDEALVLPTPERLAYKFDGWYTVSPTAGTLVPSPFTPSASVTLYAHWSLDNDLTIVASARSVLVGNKITLDTTGGFGSGALAYSVSGAGCILQGTDLNEVFVASSAASNVLCLVTATKAASTGVPQMQATLTVAFVKTVQVPSAPLNVNFFAENDALRVTFEAPVNALQSMVDHYEYSTDGGRTWISEDVTRQIDNKTLLMVITAESNAEPLDANYTYGLRLRAVSIVEDLAEGEATLSIKAFLGYSIMFDGNGGSGSMANLNIPLGDYKVLPASVFVKTDYRIAGWSSTSDGEVEFGNRSKFSPDGSVLTLYAVWAIAKYTITFDAQGGQSVAALNWQTNSAAGAVLPTPVRLGYEFAGWVYDQEATPEEAVQGPLTLTNNIKLYALWVEDNNVVLKVSSPTVLSTKRVTLSYSGGWGTKVARYSLVADESDENCVVNSASAFVTSPVEGSCVVQVTINANGSVPAMTSEPVTVYFTDATPAPLAPTITKVVSKPAAIDVYFTAPANAVDSKVSRYIYSTDENGELWANATVANGVISITKDSVTGSALLADSNYTIFIAAVSSVDSTEGEPSESATGTLGYQVTFDANGGTGTMTPQNLPKSVSLATTLAPNEFVRPGYQFVGWSIDKRDTIEDDIFGDEETYTPVANIKLYAIWQQTTFVVTLDAKGGTVDPAKLYFDSLADIPVELPVPERTAYNFTGWFAKDATGLEYEITGPIFPDDNLAVYAKWQVVNSFLLDLATYESAADKPIAVTLSGALGNGAVTYTTTSTCSVAVSKTGVVTIVAKAPGTCSVSAVKKAGVIKVGTKSTDIPQMATETYEVEFTAIDQAPLLISNRVLANPANLEVVITSSGGSGTGAVTYDTESDYCKVSLNKQRKWVVSTTVATTCQVVAYKDASGIYLDAESQAAAFVFTPLAQAKLIIANRTLSTPVMTSLALTTTGGTATGIVTYSVTSGTCSLSGATLSSDIIATCVVVATKAASGWYGSASSAPMTFRFTGLTQASVTLDNTNLNWTGLDTVDLSASGGSGTGDYFFTTSTPGCVIDRIALSVTRPATCVVTAFREEDPIYATSAGSTSKSFVFAAVAQDSVDLTNSEFNFAGTETVTLTADGGTGTGSFVYSTSNSGCVISGDKLTVTTAPNSCVVIVKRSASGVYAESTASSSQTFEFTAVDQAPLSTLAATTNTAADRIKLKGAGGSGGGAFTYSTDSPFCSIAGDTISVTKITTCDVTIGRAANGVYAAATPIVVTFTFTAAPQATVIITNVARDLNKTAGNTLALKASGGTGTGAYVFNTVTPGCIIDGANLSVDRPARCVVTATRLASGIYADSAPSVSKTVVFAGLVQAATVTISTPVQNVRADLSLTLAATSSTGTGEIYYLASPSTCVVTDNVLTVTAFGACTVTAYLKGTGFYADKASVAKKFTFVALAQAAVTIDNTVTSLKINTNNSITASGGSGAGAFTYSVAGRYCSISSTGVLKATAATTCTVTATKLANGLYDKKSVSKAFTMTR